MTRVVVDTNIYFQALYNRESKQMRLMELADFKRVEIYSPSFVKEEAWIVLGRENLGEHAKELEEFYVNWIPFESYKGLMPQAKNLISHKPDEHVVACALYLNCGILSANTRHFDTKRLRKKIKLWALDELLGEIEENET